ncbi:hypothetical protein B0H21DRAFT_750244 [Amylocystis lapponica]|nr:hypothetical protein B0H21DRAFT_750244 [Amylocystis lapponica]
MHKELSGRRRSCLFAIHDLRSFGHISLSPHMTTRRPVLPWEIWQLIVQALPTSGKRTCLFVSTSLHDLAVKFLFATVHIHFEHWSPIAWDILHHLAQNPSFAFAVKRLVVHTFSESSALFERRCLIEALRNMSNLRAFAWYFSKPEISPEIVEALVTFCPHLQEVHVPIPQRINPMLHRMTHLRSITFPPVEYDLYSQQTLVDAPPDVHEAYDSCKPTMAVCSIGLLRDLTHLELMCAAGLDNLNLFFRHSARLESLTIHLFGFQAEVEQNSRDLFTALQEEPLALPHLTSLKLLDICTRGEELDSQYAILADFIRTKKGLRRLDLDAGGTDTSLEPLFQAIADLGSLRVLGIQLNSRPSDHDDLVLLGQYAPPNLTALRIATRLPDNEGGETMRRSWLDRSITPAFVEDVTARLERLETVGFCEGLFDIVRKEGGGTFKQWNERMVARRSVFGSDDWEWLMRHHNLKQYHK